MVRNGREGGPEGFQLPALRDVVIAVTVIALFAVFLYSVRGILSPPVAFLLLIFVLAPGWGRPVYRALSIIATALFLLWILRETGFLIAPFALAFILAYILDPLVDQVQRLRVPRGVAILILAVPALAAVTFALVFGLPAVGGEARRLIQELPEAWDSVAAWLTGIRGRIIALGLPGLTDETLPRIDEVDAQAVAAYVQSQSEELGRRFGSAVLGFGKGLASALTVLGYVVLTPILTFYLLRDYDRILAKAADLIPHDRREGWKRFASHYDTLLSRYLRGQVLVATLVGLLTFVGFWILDFPFALVLGVVAGVFNLVPYLGVYVSLVPALAIALLSGSLLISLVKVAVVFGAVQVLEGAVLGPLIVGEAVEMNPVWIIAALALFGFFFGFVGLLMAVPLAIFFKLAFERGLAAYRASEFYRGPRRPDRGR